jgi:hypothetical protein
MFSVIVFCVVAKKVWACFRCKPICWFFFLWCSSIWVSFRLELESNHGHGLNIHSGICLVLEGTVETPSGMVGKKAHKCHLHLPNALYSTVSLHVTSTHNLRGRNLQLLHSENGFYATRTAQADADSNQQPESSNVRHATHSTTRLGNCIGLLHNTEINRPKPEVSKNIALVDLLTFE